MATSWISSFLSHPIGARIAYYPTVMFGILKTNPQRRWYDRIDEKVVLGALPFHKTAQMLVLKEQVTRVVTLNEPYETRFLCPSEQQWLELGAEQLCIPTVDYNNAPTLDQVKAAVKFIVDTTDNRSTYVHCKAGRSRSATVVVCYLMNRYKLNPEAAIAFLRTKRPQIILGKAHYERILNYYLNM